ncbi:MAG: hypothetical protein IKT90_06225, partial [Clostridia bacterium]|nr:hypothetical protein [Clostridia bacterium]
MSKEIDELMKQVLGNGKAARRGLNNLAGSASRTKAEEEASAMETSMGQLLRQQQAQLRELEQQQTQRESATQKAQRELDAMDAMSDRMNRQLQEQLDEMKRMSRELDLDLPQTSAAQSASAYTLQQPESQAKHADPAPADRMTVAKALGEAAKQAVEDLPGQEAFLKQLGIAFKRPYVTGWDAPAGARSTILVRGSRGSGRHLALRKMSDALQACGVPGALVEMDLSLYPSNSQERLFLQDLYSALESGGVVVFDNYDKCHPA